VINLISVSDLVIDRVFRSDCSTRQVYEEAAKEVALSVVSGINCEFIFFDFLSSFIRISFHGTSMITFFFDSLINQQAFLHMDKQAVEKLTP